MEYGAATIVDDLDSVEMRAAHPAVYDRDIELSLLFEDPDSGAEHYPLRYPALGPIQE